jgi:hypothetical protein
MGEDRHAGWNLGLDRRFITRAGSGWSNRHVESAKSCASPVFLEERLLKFADNARAAAKLVAPSREQDELLSKAQRAETLANAADRLTSGPYLYGP